jgi:hypothetical protein
MAAGLAVADFGSHRWQRHNFENFHPSTWHLKMRVIPAEQFRCGVMRFSLHDRVAADVVLRV